MKDKLWIVSELFYPEDTSTGYIMTEIAKKLSSQYDVSVIAGPMSYTKIKLKHPKLNGSLGNIDIFRIAGNGYDKNKLIKRVIGQLHLSFKMLSYMLKFIKSGDKVLMVTNPILLLLFVGVFSKKKNWLISLLVHDIFPDNLIPSGLLKKNGLLYKFLIYIFNFAYRNMSDFIVLGRDMEVIMRKKYPKIPVRIIENWSEVDLIKDSHTKKDNELSNNGLTFLFAGNFGRVQGLDVLLSGIKLVKSDNFDVKFLGDGVMKDFIKSFIETNKMNNVVLLDRQPREQQNLFLNNCQVGIVSLTKGMYGMGVPSKFYNLLAAGKAIFYIGDENTELQFVLNEYKNGWFAKAGDVSQIREVFEEIIACDQNEIIAKGIRSRKLAEEVYAKEIILSKYLSSIIE